MLEIETKYQLVDQAALLKKLNASAAIPGPVEEHADTYFRHPSRDFVATKEALRVRRINSVASVTYKGPKLDVGDTALKARKEIEWCLSPGDADGNQMTQLLEALGFTPVATVRKRRQPFSWPDGDPRHDGFTLTIDQVQQVGLFAEIELLVSDESPEQVRAAGERIRDLAVRLGLTTAVRQSYLTMLLQQLGQQ